ncbi:hypothetical protein UFOVP711_48 [uncultured Caudovirales phage]|uniref:Uncharacterized protein n=1 Tax=uncultured Caudovirales phage TaxID=2100421 RepID=A0A6J5NMV3_9CAUD|nr:hypothetical protein UFOVP711_48 [uncultured Caudovirales phage]
MTSLIADSLREQARLEARKSQESFDRSDTDGSLSQWAHEQTERRLMKEADLAENNGMAEFPALFRDGTIVKAKIVDGQYGAVWMLLDDNGNSTGEFAPLTPKRASTLAKRGFTEGLVKRPARIQAASGSWRFASISYFFVPLDWMDEPAEIITTDIYAEG